MYKIKTKTQPTPKPQQVILITLILLLTIFVIFSFTTGCQKIQPEQIQQPIQESHETKSFLPPQPSKPQQQPPKTNSLANANSKPKSIPSSIENYCIGFLLGTIEEMPLIAMANGRWIRPHPGPFSWDLIEPKQGEFNFKPIDDLVKIAQHYNIAILPTIWPYASWDQSKCHSTECLVTPEDEFYNIIPNSRCNPCDWNAYELFLSELVERYDGDNFRDMPGLQIPIKYWEILNEPEMKEKHLTFFKENEKEYVELLKHSYKAIKKACPDCKVVQGGCAGNSEWMLKFWDKVLALGANYFDIANIHFISHGDAETLNVKDFKALLKKHNIEKPIWVTEAEFVTEENLIEYSKNAMKSGATKIFFTKVLIDETKKDPSALSPIYKNIEDVCKTD